jgi:hypothetical protein
MSTFLSLSEIPRDRDGAIVGQYHVRDRASGRSLEEVGERAVGAGELDRLDAAFGSYMTIAPADADTAERCARHVYERTKDPVRAKALRTMFAKPRPKAPKKKDEST